MWVCGLVRACVCACVWMVLLVKPMMRCLRSDNMVTACKEAVHLVEATDFLTNATYMHNKAQAYIFKTRAN